MARKLKAMPLTEAAWLTGILTSGQVRAVVGNVSKRTAEQYTAQEADVLAIIVALDGKDTVKAMQSWSNYAEALLADDPEKPPREDEFFHSQTTGGRYAANGNFAAVTGAVIAKAIELAEDRQPPRPRLPQPRRSAAAKPSPTSAASTSTTNTASPPIPTPTRRSCRRNGTGPSSSASPTTDDIANHAGAQLLNGPRIDHQAFEALSCTAQLLRLVLDEHGAVRRYEMMPASVTDALFGAIAARDQHCRWPGCHKQPIHCDVHHVHFRENGGPNTSTTAASLGHHHRVHEQQRRLTGTGEATTRTRVSSRGAAASPLRRSRTRKTTRTCRGTDARWSTRALYVCGAQALRECGFLRSQRALRRWRRCASHRRS